MKTQQKDDNLRRDILGHEEFQRADEKLHYTILFSIITFAIFSFITLTLLTVATIIYFH